MPLYGFSTLSLFFVAAASIVGSSLHLAIDLSLSLPKVGPQLGVSKREFARVGIIKGYDAEIWGGRVVYISGAKNVFLGFFS